jgi:pilus assembly protein CpaB
MNRRLIIILVIALAVASACAFLVYRVVGNTLAASHQQPTSQRVVAAVQDIKLGTLLTPADLTTIEISGPLPKGAITDPKNVVNRGVISDLYQGEPILESRLAPIGSGGGLAATIPTGMRACAVRVDEVVGVAGFVTPGMRVDILISGNPPGVVNVTAGPKVKTLLQNIQVLSAGQDIQKDGQGKPQQVQVVNVLVTPDQAEILSLASSQTHIQMVLRNPLDTQIAQTPGTTEGNLFADKNPAPVKRAAPVATPKAAPPVFSIEVINGNSRSQEKFATPGGNQ